MRKYSVNTNKLSHLLHGVALSALIAGGLALASPVHAAANTETPNWNPRASEKLVKLPSSVFKKSIDHDFRESALGLAIQSLEEDEKLKVTTLIDLKNAIESAEGETRTELRHQLLAEKRAYIELLSKKNSLRSKHLRTKQKLFERMLKSMGEREASLTPQRLELIKRQEAARTRFQSTFDKVDVAIFKASLGPETKYTVKYAENMAAMEKLFGRINSHRMNTAIQVDGQKLTKAEYVRQLLADSQADVALLKQEETMLGYMAKLVALDALDLSEQALDTDLSDSDNPGERTITRAVDIFMSN